MEYVMSDIHGDFYNFYKMLVKINLSSFDTLYILGDILDKNEENLCLYSFIRDEANIILIKGNHEYLCERYIDGTISGHTWEVCGGTYTKREVDALGKKNKERLYEYLRNLPLYKSVDVKGTEYFLTHSGFHADKCIKNKEGIVDIKASVEKAIRENQESYLFSDDIHYIPSSLVFDKKVIVGHYPTLLLPDHREATIFYGKNYIDIDTGNDRRKEGGRLSCLCLTNGKEFYV